MAAVARRQRQPVGVHDELVAVLVVPPVAHQLTDVVQQCRRLEQRALLRRCSRAPRRAGRRAGARGSAPARRGAGRPGSARRTRAARGGDRCRPGVVGARHLQQQALAQAERAHRDAARIGEVEQFRGDGEPGEDDVGALRVEPRDVAALLRRCGCRATRAAAPLRPSGRWCRGSLSGTGSPRRPIAIRPRLVKVPPEPMKTGLVHSRQRESLPQHLPHVPAQRLDFLARVLAAGSGASR